MWQVSERLPAPTFRQCQVLKKASTFLNRWFTSRDGHHQLKDCVVGPVDRDLVESVEHIADLRYRRAA